VVRLLGIRIEGGGDVNQMIQIMNKNRKRKGLLGSYPPIRMNKDNIT
jgi:hypothetical protein